MRPSLRALSPALAAALLVPTLAAAADISWSAGPTFGGASGHLGILTNGSVVAAVDLAGTDGGAVTVDPGGLNLVFTRVNSPWFTTPFADSQFGAPNNIGDAGWSQVIDTAEYSAGVVDAPTFLSGLVVGRSYQVQFFSGRSYPGLDNRLLTISDGNGNASPTLSQGQNLFQSVVGTFVADATTQRIVFTENTALPVLNAYVLLEVAPIPEPGTWALWLAGLGTLGALARRARPAAA